MKERHYFGCGFAVHTTLEPYVKEFNFVTKKIVILKIDTKPLNIILVTFYEDLSQIYDKFLENLIKLIRGNLNANYGRETHIMPIIGRESLHETNNGNEFRTYILRNHKR